MSRVVKLSWDDVGLMLRALPKTGKCYGIPRGGAVVAGLTGRPADTPEAADWLVDDIVDSGRTRKDWLARYPGKPFHALVDKTSRRLRLDGWVQFPWEEPAQQDAEENVVRLLEFLGEDPTREGLRDTPRRVVKAWKEMTAGYVQDPSKVLGTDFGSDGYDEMICTKRIKLVSVCEHHMLPFVGHAWIAYVPHQRVVGLSKMSRLLRVFACRLQIQERLTMQVARTMMDVLKPQGVGVKIEAVHSCMSCRGVMEPESSMVTCALLGVFKQPEVRAEFFAHTREL